MKQPLQITFHNMESSEVMEANIRDTAKNLSRFYDQIMSCRVVVEAHHRIEVRVICTMSTSN